MTRPIESTLRRARLAAHEHVVGGRQRRAIEQLVDAVDVALAGSAGPEVEAVAGDRLRRFAHAPRSARRCARYAASSMIRALMTDDPFAAYGLRSVRRRFLFGSAYAPLLNDAPGFELKCGSMSVILRQSERNLAARCALNDVPDSGADLRLTRKAVRRAVIRSVKNRNLTPSSPRAARSRPTSSVGKV